MNASRFAGLLTVGLLLTACGPTADADERTGGDVDVEDGVLGQPDESGDDLIGGQGSGAAGTCPHGTVDCVDADLDPDLPDPNLPDPELPADPAGDFDSDGARDAAAGLLGLAEEDLQGLDDVRIGVVDGEALALTEDYVLGRRTVELETDDGRTLVTAVTVELPDGPERLTLP